MYRSPSLEIKELMALCGGERSYSVRDEDGTSEEYDLDSEGSEEGRGGRGIRSSLSLEIYGLQREQHVYFSNQEYYRRLEELKGAHLRNMAELERMYISEQRERLREEDDGGLRRGRRESRQSFRKLQRINSQEELDFHETSSGSDQSEVCEEDTVVDLKPNSPRRSLSQDQTFRRDILLSPEDTMTQMQFWLQPKPQGRLTRHTEVRAWSNSKVTVPKPFKMMLREEERKKHKVRTRSEIELENMLLRRELEELRECQKQFRASPAPAHIRLPLYDIISRRPTQRSNHSRSSSDNQNFTINQTSAASAQPFHFLERERRKREARIVAELGNFDRKQERRAFKARPMPSSVYGSRHKDADSKTTTERKGSDPNSDVESDLQQSPSDTSPDSGKPQRSPGSKPVKKQIELSIELVKEREWSYVDPVKPANSPICSPL